MLSLIISNVVCRIDSAATELNLQLNEIGRIER